MLAGVDRVIAMGIADPDRLAVTGWSAGGHLVNKLITFTTRFKAASSYAGVADWISLYGQSDTRGDRDLWMGGTLWQKNAPIDTLLGAVAAEIRHPGAHAHDLLHRRETIRASRWRKRSR